MSSCSDGCGGSCGINAAPEIEIEPEIQAAAEKLAGLLVETPEFQNFMRTSRTVRLDRDVNELVNRINGSPFGADKGEMVSAEALQERLEQLPVVQGYRQAEALVQSIFSAVDETISVLAGVAFAVNAKPASCGS